MKKIKTFADACTKVGKNPKGRYTASQKVDIIVAAIVGKWKADYSKGDQLKWRPWFIWDVAASAFRFCYSFDGYGSSTAGGGVRRVFETEAQSDYAAKTFLKEFNDELQGK